MSQVRNTPGTRPLTARSVLLSTLLGTHPPVLPVGVLVRAGELFGIAEGTVRVALSRMVAAGELEAVDGSYGLAGRLLERQARQEASVVARTRAWKGAWRFSFVVGGRRSAGDRGDLRSAMRALRMAELREGVWLRPDNLPAPVPSRPEVSAQCLTVVGKLEPGVDPVSLSSELWDVAGWATEASRLRRELASSLVDVRAGAAAALAPGFVLSASVLRHLQADPLLPPELLPDGWPGAALRSEYAAWDDAYRTLLRSWWKPA
jgi:phenylacetic acid degradation operon negative regulatory protein